VKAGIQENIKEINMKELEDAMVAAFRKMAKAGTIQEIIEKQISKTVEEILSNALKSYSDFGRNMEKVVKESMNVDLKGLGLSGYNDIILKIIKTKIDNGMETFGKAQIEKDLEELLKAPPAEIKLSELVEQLKQDAIGPDRQCGECTCIIEWSNTDGYGRIYLDEDYMKEKRSCAYELAFSKDGEVYSFSIEGRDPSKKIFCGPFYGFERLLFQMYTAKTKLIVDEDGVNTFYPGCD